MQREISSSYLVPSRIFSSCLNRKLIIKFRELTRKEGRLGKSYRATMQEKRLSSEPCEIREKLSINFIVSCIDL